MCIYATGCFLILNLSFTEGIRKNYHLISHEVEQYMTDYEVGKLVSLYSTLVVIPYFQHTADPNIIAQLVFRLQEWFKAWSPPQECVLIAHPQRSLILTIFTGLGLHSSRHSPLRFKPTSSPFFRLLSLEASKP